ncbi:MAG: NYN domain-containing protein [bacterium]
MNRTTFLIDGFNLYHSVRDASRALGGTTTKWLNIRSLCDSYLHVIGNNAQTQSAYYFSALAKHLIASDPDKVKRHKTLIEALESTGVIVELAQFKEVTIRYRSDTCWVTLKRHEEKETDVAISAKLFEIFITDECDTVVLVTGDTDLAPAVRTAKKLFPSKGICFAFPYKRKNKELAKLADISFNINPRKYLQHQFPDPVVLADGRKIYKPSVW